MTSKIVRVKSNVANGDLSLMRMQCRVCLREPVTLEHVEHGSLAGVVETEEDNVGTLLEEAEPLHSPAEEIYNEHINNLPFIRIILFLYNINNYNIN